MEDKLCDVTDLVSDSFQYVNPESKASPGGPMLSTEAYNYLKDFLGLPNRAISFRLHAAVNDVVKVEVEYMPRSKV